MSKRTQVHLGGWEPTGNGVWEQVVRLPPDARVHMPCEDGRIVDGARLALDAEPWGGDLRVSAVVVEIDGSAVRIGLQEGRKATLYAHVGRRRDCTILTLTFIPAACARAAAEDTPPDLTVDEHVNVAAAWHQQVQWMDAVWPRHPCFSPQWAKEIPAAVYVEMWTGSGIITHTFDDLVGLLRAMHERGVPRGALLYFWGFHAPFDTNYPEYWPAKELGGERGLSSVVEAAREFGYRLMPHLNYWGCDGRLPLYQDFRNDQVRDVDGARQGWRFEGEPPIEYIRPSSRAWQDVFSERCRRFVERFPVDALFFDQVGGRIDDPDCDFDAAMPEFFAAVQSACPSVALGGELFHERCRSLPIWQVWGTPWCGLPVQEEHEHATMWRDLFGGHCSMLAHMGMPAAVPVEHCWPSYYWYIEHHGLDTAARLANRWQRSIGAVPSIRVNYAKSGLDGVALDILLGG